jgi:hypothetical protein
MKSIKKPHIPEVLKTRQARLSLAGLALAVAIPTAIHEAQATINDQRVIDRLAPSVDELQVPNVQQSPWSDSLAVRQLASPTTAPASPFPLPTSTELTATDRLGIQLDNEKIDRDMSFALGTIATVGGGIALYEIALQSTGLIRRRRELNRLEEQFAAPAIEEPHRQ